MGGWGGGSRANKEERGNLDPLGGGIYTLGKPGYIGEQKGIKFKNRRGKVQELQEKKKRSALRTKGKKRGGVTKYLD